MSNLTNLTPQQIQELQIESDEALSLLRSQEWKQWVEFLKRRAKKLQNYVNDAVEKGDIVDARVQLALMRDCQKQTEAFAQQVLQGRKNLNEHNKEKNNGQR